MSTLVALAVALVAAASIPLLITLFNVAVWRRGRADGRISESISVLIPARNEAANIDACLAAAQASQHPILEILVYDDASTDDTAARVQARAREDRRIRLIRGAELPRGWAGKSHACHRLAEVARGRILLFVDADVQLEPDGVARIGSLFHDLGVDLVSAIPRQLTGTWAERLVLPLLYLTYTSWLPLPLVHRSRDPRFLAVNGQVLSIRADVYEAIGGFATVKDNVVEDMAFCRHVKRQGFRLTFADGHHIGRCRMYTNAREVWEGFSKNLYRGLGADVRTLAGVFGLYLWCFVAPYAVVVAAGAAGAARLDIAGYEPLVLAGFFGVAANTLLRALIAHRYEQSWSGIVTHPLSVLALIAIGINSFLWHQRGTIRWRGRVYGGPAERPAPDLMT